MSAPKQVHFVPPTVGPVKQKIEKQQGQDERPPGIRNSENAEVGLYPDKEGKDTCLKQQVKNLVAYAYA